MRWCAFLVLFIYGSSTLFASVPREAWLDELRFSSFRELSQSERMLKKAMLKNPGNPNYHFELSRVYAAYYDRKRRNNLEEAEIYLDLSEKELQIAMMAEPESIAAHYNLGVVAKRQKEYEKSREHFKTVLELSDSAADRYVRVSALMQIGSIYQEQGFYDDARDLYLIAKELDYYHPDIEAALEDLAFQEKTARRIDAAVPGRPHYRASDLVAYGNRSLAANDPAGGGLGQILPFLGMMLFQQMMQGWGSRNDEGPGGGFQDDF